VPVNVFMSAINLMAGFVVVGPVGQGHKNELMYRGEFVCELAEKLSSPDVKVRTAAVLALRNAPARGVFVTALAEQARDTVPALTRRAANSGWEFAVGTLHVDPGNEAAVAMLTKELQSRDKYHSKATIARELAKLGTGAKPLIPALLPVVEDSGIEIRWAAADALKAIGPEAALKAGVKVP